MASDLVVALGQATVSGTTLIGCKGHARRGQRQRLQLLAGGNHPPDDSVRATYLRLPQARQTYAVLGCQPEGTWGFADGVNEHHVAVGVAGWHSRLPAVGGGLTGTDLARLALERSHTALHALDILTDLIARHGQCPEGGTRAPADNLFLVADGQEAFVLESAGRYWAVLECPQDTVTSAITAISARMRTGNDTGRMGKIVSSEARIEVALRLNMQSLTSGPKGCCTLGESPEASTRGRLPKGSTVVCTVTGNGLKDPEWAISGAPKPVTVPVDAHAAAAQLGLA